LGGLRGGDREKIFLNRKVLIYVRVEEIETRLGPVAE
jgi:membrane protein YdbS with pleckstrin-like domain